MNIPSLRKQSLWQLDIGKKIIGCLTQNTFTGEIARNLVFRLLSKIEYGTITLIDAKGKHSFGKTASPHSTIYDFQFEVYQDIAFGGMIGAAEAYIQEKWKTDELTELVRILALNKQVFEEMNSRFAQFREKTNLAFHWLRKNTRIGSKKNIQAHYDLGNDFFKLFLDETMMYSCAIFPSHSSSLYEASIYKLERICQKLELQPQDRVIEIGTGWGGFAIHAAKHYGCHITTVTISQEQFDFANERIREEGLTDQITVLLQDYRDIEGKFNKLVSIEMIEAVGHQYLQEYFRVCSQLLTEEGMMLIQAIVTDEKAFEAGKNTVDFIQKYIFPGGCVPSITAMNTAIRDQTNMRMFHLEDFGPHYATTLKHWRENFFRHLAQVKQLGYSNEFIRMWEYYLSYCEGGFWERIIGCVQVLYTKPMCRRECILPALSN